jgi:hypothetical protein
MSDTSTPAEQWDRLTRMLEEALQLTRHLADGTTSFHIECALDEVCSRLVPQDK